MKELKKHGVRCACGFRKNKLTHVRAVVIVSEHDRYCKIGAKVIGPKM